MDDNGSKELIAFYNVENLFPPDAPQNHRTDPTNSCLRNWDDRKYQDKLRKIASVFNLIQESESVLPMIIGISEVQGQKPLEELVTMAPFHPNYGVIHYDSMDERGVDVALLYDKSKVEIIFSEPITYFFEIEDNNPANYDTTRDILHCKVLFSHEIIHVFVLHLPSKRERNINQPKRDYILQELHEIILQIDENTDEKIVICGDFNENPDEKNINNILYNKHFNKILINPFEKLYANGIFSTYHYKDGLLFDQMIASSSFFNDNSSFQFTEAKVFNHQKLTSNEKGFRGRPYRTYAGTRYLGGYSDHFPIITEFRKKG